MTRRAKNKFEGAVKFQNPKLPYRASLPQRASAVLIRTACPSPFVQAATGKMRDKRSVGGVTYRNIAKLDVLPRARGHVIKAAVYCIFLVFGSAAHDHDSVD